MKKRQHVTRGLIDWGHSDKATIERELRRAPVVVNFGLRLLGRQRRAMLYSYQIIN